MSEEVLQKIEQYVLAVLNSGEYVDSNLLSEEQHRTNGEISVAQSVLDIIKEHRANHV